MSNWICSKCNVKMETADDIQISYGDADLPPAEGYRCPKCKCEFLDGEYVVNELVSVEEMLEGK
jgi:ribosomal protein L37AE/L43A